MRMNARDQGRNFDTRLAPFVGADQAEQFPQRGDEGPGRGRCRPRKRSVCRSRSSPSSASAPASPTCSAPRTGRIIRAPSSWSATSPRWGDWPRCCWRARKPTGPSRKRESGGLQIACVRTKRRPFCARCITPDALTAGSFRLTRRKPAARRRQWLRPVRARPCFRGLPPSRAAKARYPRDAAAPARCRRAWSQPS